MNEYPNLAELPLPRGDSLAGVARYAAGFEALRDRSDAFLEKTGARPRCAACRSGRSPNTTSAPHSSTNLLASGGIEAVTDSDARWRLSEVAVICGTDARYATEASAAVDAARKSGVSHVLLAGPEKAVASPDYPVDSKPDGYLTAKIDAVGALSDLLTRLGA